MPPRPPVLTLLAGSNGAGKSSAAPVLLASRIPLERFVNADLIALALHPAVPCAVRQEAGRLALERVAAFEQERLDFALETTLSGRWTTRLIDRLLASGWTIELRFLWRPSAEVAIDRVRSRADRRLGHVVPEADVRRRFTRGLVNLELLRPTVASWTTIDARDITELPVIAQGSGAEIAIQQTDVWPLVVESIREARRAAADSTPADDDHPPGARRVREAVTGPRSSSEQHPAPAHPPFDGDDLEECFIRANRATVLRHRRLGAPLIVWRNGRTVEVDPWQVELPPLRRG